MHDERRLGEGAELILGKRLVFQPGETEAQGLCVPSGEEGRADPTSRWGQEQTWGSLGHTALEDLPEGWGEMGVQPRPA